MNFLQLDFEQLVRADSRCISFEDFSFLGKRDIAPMVGPERELASVFLDGEGLPLCRFRPVTDEVQGLF